ncbi:MAG: ribonucleotide reductase N-terminal alpha domain-containing protein, partial [Pseudomonadota bacterium]
MSTDPFTTPISRLIWETKYRWRDGEVIHDRTLEDSWRRMARALAAVEPSDKASWEEQFLSILRGFRFLPGGRIQAGAGTG